MYWSGEKSEKLFLTFIDLQTAYDEKYVHSSPSFILRNKRNKNRGRRRRRTLIDSKTAYDEKYVSEGRLRKLVESKLREEQKDRKKTGKTDERYYIHSMK